jgi:hypothetical protein
MKSMRVSGGSGSSTMGFRACENASIETKMDNIMRTIFFIKIFYGAKIKK